MTCGGPGPPSLAPRKTGHLPPRYREGTGPSPSAHRGRRGRIPALGCPPRAMSKCLCCGEGAKVPASELFGATFKEHEGCVSYTMHSSPCGSTNVCVCMYCAGCPFWGWDMCVCKTDDAGDCYLGVAGSSLFVMTVVSKVRRNAYIHVGSNGSFLNADLRMWISV